MTKDFDTDISIQPNSQAEQQITTINFFTQQSINGNHNTQLSGVFNLFFNNADDVAEQVKYVSRQQAFKLYQLIDQIADFEYRLKSQPKSYLEIWTAFKTKFNISEYANLPASEFSNALSFLKSYLGSHYNA
jgi:ORF6C domain-containing protein